MNASDVYTTSLKTSLLEYKNVLDKNNYLTPDNREAYIKDKLSKVDNTSTLFDNIHIKMTHNNKKVFSSIISLSKEDTPIIDEFNIDFKYKDNVSGKEISTTAKSLLQDNLPDIYSLFSGKSTEFAQKYRTLRTTKVNDPWMLYSGGTGIEITVLGDEYGNIIVSENNEFIVF